MSDFVSPKEQFESIKFCLWKFHSYILSLRKDGYDIYSDSIREQCKEINSREDELNDLVESVYKTGKRYDFLEFSRYHLPLSRDFYQLLNQ